MLDTPPRTWDTPNAPLETILRPNEEAVLSYPVTPTSRGRFLFGDFHVRIEHAPGLAVRQFKVKAPEEVRVYPDLREVARYELMARRSRLQEHGFHRSRLIGRGTEFERIRDFLVLHYHANQRDDSNFWNDRRAAPIPDSLAWKMDLFRERGTVVGYKDGFFKEPSWLAVYLGQNIMPDGHDPLVEALDPAQAARTLAELKAAVARTVEAMPAHEAFLRSFADARSPA